MQIVHENCTYDVGEGLKLENIPLYIAYPIVIILALLILFLKKWFDIQHMRHVYSAASLSSASPSETVERGGGGGGGGVGTSSQVVKKNASLPPPPPAAAAAAAASAPAAAAAVVFRA